MCKKFFQGLFGGKAAKVAPPATPRGGGDEGGEAVVLAPEAIDQAGGPVRLSGRTRRRRRGGATVAGLQI